MSILMMVVPANIFHGSGVPGALIESVVVMTGLLALRHSMFWILPSALELLLLLDDGLTSSTGILVLLPALVDIAAAGYLRAAWSGVLAAHVVFVIALLSTPGVPWFFFIFLSFLLAIAACSGTLVSASNLRRLSEQMIRERRRHAEHLELARTIHDTLAAQLTHVTMLSRTMQHELSSPQARSLNIRIQGEARQCLTDLRRLIDALRSDDISAPSSSATRGLDRAWREAVQLLTKAGFSAETSRPVTDIAISPRSEQLAVICLREIAGNVMRHAPPGSAVHLEMDIKREEIIMASRNIILPSEDRGTFPDSGYGLIGLRERLESAGGSLEAGRTGDRWVISARLPLVVGEMSGGC